MHRNEPNMRQLHTFIASGSAKKAKIEARPTPKGPVDTTPGGVHSRFRRQFRGFHSKKRSGGHVDSKLVYIIKSDHCPPASGGAQTQKQNQVSQPDPASAAATLGGALSLSTEPVRESSRYGVWIWAHSFKLLAGNQDATVEAILRSFTMACTCCVELDETAHLSFGIRSIC